MIVFLFWHFSHQHHHSMGHYGQYSHGSTATLTTMKEAKKRQRRSLVEKISGSLSQDLGASKTPTPTPTGKRFSLRAQNILRDLKKNSANLKFSQVASNNQ